MFELQKMPPENSQDLSILVLPLQLISYSSVAQLCWILQPHGLQHARLPYPSISHGVCSNSCPLSKWCYPTISSLSSPSPPDLSVPASGSFPISQFFASGDQSIGVSASAAILPMNILDWFPLGLTGLNSTVQGTVKSLLNTTVQKHQFFGAQLSLSSNSHIHTWLLEKP